MLVEHVWNVIAHAQKQDLVFQGNGRVHLSRRGRQFSRLLAAEVCASAVVMLDTPCSEVEWKTIGYPLHSPVSPSLPLPCVTVCHHISAGVYTHRFSCKNTLIYAQTTYRTFPTCDISMGSLKLPAPGAGEFVDLILLYLWNAVCIYQTTRHRSQKTTILLSPSSSCYQRTGCYTHIVFPRF